MFIEEKEYSRPQFELVVINSVDIMTGSKETDIGVGFDDLIGSLNEE